jgi:cell division protein FtsB
MPTPPTGRRPRSTPTEPKSTDASSRNAKGVSARPSHGATSKRDATGERTASPRRTKAKGTKRPAAQRPVRPVAAAPTTAARGPDGRTAGTRRASLHTAPLARVAGRVLLPLLILASIVVVLGYAVFPTRTWLDQRATIAERQDELAALDAEIADLTATVRLLGTDTEIERIARVDHGLVKPGEEAFAVLPSVPEPVRMPAAWPFVTLADAID